jgi:hypothetical protein
VVTASPRKEAPVPDQSRPIPSLDGPYTPDETLRVAELIAEAVRYLNYATRTRDAFEYPSQLDTAIRSLSSAASRLPQLLEQVSGWLADEQAIGRLEIVSGEHAGDTPVAVITARGWLAEAGHLAGRLQVALDAAAAVTSTIAAAGGEDAA